MRVAVPRRSSRHSAPTWRSRWRSSWRSLFTGLVLDARRVRPLAWPTPATRRCCCSAASGAQGEAPRKHPFGYGRERYFYAFVVAIVLFTVGALFSLYEGWHKIATRSPRAPVWAARGAGLRDRRRGLLVPHGHQGVPRSSSGNALLGGSSSAGPRPPSFRSCCWRTSAR